MLVKHGDLQPIIVIEPVDVSDENTKKHLKATIEKTKKLEENTDKLEGQNAK